MKRHTQWFVRCDGDGFINWSRPYPSFGIALDRATETDEGNPACGPHAVVAREWVTSDEE